jgi:hypothetical protein
MPASAAPLFRPAAKDFARLPEGTTLDAQGSQCLLVGVAGVLTAAIRMVQQLSASLTACVSDRDDDVRVFVAEYGCNAFADSTRCVCNDSGLILQ